MMQTILDQITWSHAAALYLGLCLGIALVLIGKFISEDLKGPDHKFGYNYKSLMSYLLLVFVSVPGLNLLTLTFVLWVSAFRWLENYKAKLGKKYAKSV